MIKPLTGLAGLGLTLMVQAAPILPEKTTHITLSNQDVNRLVCTQGMISDVNYSAEKGMQVKIDGQNAFVKFQWLHNGQDKTYLTDPSELFLTCDGEVYSLVIEPKARRTRTVHLGNPVKQTIRQNLALYRPLTLEEQVIDLTLRAMTDDLPDSFEVYTPPQRQWQTRWVRGLRLAKVRDITPTGIGLTLSEYLVVSDYERHTQLRETQFLVPELGTQILGVTLNPLTLPAGAGSRLYLVTRTHHGN